MLTGFERLFLTEKEIKQFYIYNSKRFRGVIYLQIVKTDHRGHCLLEIIE